MEGICFHNAVKAFLIVIQKIGINIYIYFGILISNFRKSSGFVFQVEHYNNLTLKSIHMLKLLLLLYTNSTKFLIKIDDDSFLNLPRLSFVLLTETLDQSNAKDTKFGNLFVTSTAHFPNTQEMNEKFLRRWKTATYLYNQTLYPQHLSGSCYIMTFSGAECLLRKSMDVLFYHLEDVYLTGFVAEACEIPRVDIPGIKKNLALRFQQSRKSRSRSPFSNCRDCQDQHSPSRLEILEHKPC